MILYVAESCTIINRDERDRVAKPSDRILRWKQSKSENVE